MAQGKNFLVVKIFLSCALLLALLSMMLHGYFIQSSLTGRDEDALAQHYFPAAYHHRYSSNSPKSANITESFVISLDPGKADRFIERNRHADLDPVLWVPGVDGFHQRNLDVWAQLLPAGKHPPLNASAFTAKDKGLYASPHAVGCYLAHWNLLRTLGHRPVQLRPEAYLVFEDDTSCAPNLASHVLKTIRQLPEDWDMLYVGGKPIAYFRNAVDVSAVLSKATNPSDGTARSSTSTLRRDICRGDFGMAHGPLAPDGSRVLLEDQQPYWQTKYMANTDAYVLNPNRIHHLLEHLNPHKHTPIDMFLGDLIARNEIQAFMTTRLWCIQPREGKTSAVLDAPLPWQGYFGFLFQPVVDVHPALNGKSYAWQTDLRLENCTY